MSTKHRIWTVSCPVCKKEFSDNVYLRRHMSTNHMKELHSCPKCDSDFNSDSDLAMHRMTSECESSHSGSLHGQMFSSEESLSTHEEKEHPCLQPEKLSGTTRYVASTHDVGKLFKCETCGQDFITLESLHSHMKAHVKDQSYSCALCQAVLQHSYNLREHIQEVHTAGGKPYKCSLCSDIFTTEREFGDHLVGHSELKKSDNLLNFIKVESVLSKDNLDKHVRTHETVEKLVKCKVCGNVFNSEYGLSQHMKLKHGRNRPGFRCNICLDYFWNHLGLKKHEKEHRLMKLFKCQTCKKTFGTMHGMKTHMYVHSEEKPYKCALCKAGIRLWNELLTHIQVVHATGSRPYKCDLCEKMFSNKREFCDHIGEHSGGKKIAKWLIGPINSWGCIEKDPASKNDETSQFEGSSPSKHVKSEQEHIHGESDTTDCITSSDSHMMKHLVKNQFELSHTCTVCGKVFRLQSHLAEHMISHYRNEFPCQFCGKVCKTSENLRKHLMEHGVVEKSLKCEVCESVFKSEKGLNQHVIGKHGKKQPGFHCKICSELFRSRLSLRKHEKEHVLLKKFICQTCKIGFGSLLSLHRHMEVHREDNLYQCALCKVECRVWVDLLTHIQGAHATGSRPYKCGLCESILPKKKKVPTATLR